MTKDDIRQMCEGSMVYARAESIYNSKMIGDFTIEQYEEVDEYIVSSMVQGSGWNVYDTALYFEQSTGELRDYQCSCPAYFSYGGMCKHCAALALTYLDRIDEVRAAGLLDFKVKTSPLLMQVMERSIREKNKEMQKASGNIELEAELTDSGFDYYGRRKWSLTFKIGDTRKYVIKNLADFATTVENETSFSYGKQLSFIHSKSAFTSKSWKYAEIILDIARRYSGYEGMFYDRSLKKELFLDRESIEKFLMINLNQSVVCHYNGRKDGMLEVIDENPKFKISLTEDEQEGYRLEIPALDYIQGERDNFIKIRNKVYHCTEDFIQGIEYILQAADRQETTSYRIAEGDMGTFYAAIASSLEPLKVLNKGKISLEEYKPKAVKITYYIDESNGKVTLKTVGSYGDKECTLPAKAESDGIYHDLLKERKALETAEAYFPENDAANQIRYFNAEDDDRMFYLLSTGIQQLEQVGMVYAADTIAARKIVRSPKTQIGISLKSNLLNLTMNTEEFTREELAEALESYKKKKKFYRLKSGDFLDMEDESFKTVAELFGGLMIDKKELKQDSVTVPKYRACYIDEMLKKGTEQANVERSQDYKSIIRSMKNIEDSDYVVPQNLKNVLRSYQKNGYRWLRTLAEFGFGGILADDMGLGKTIQTIACIQGRKDDGNTKPSLIISPASLIYNWEKELKRFAPDLKVCMITGNAQYRQEQIGKVSQADVCVTSYDMLKRDIEYYENQSFDLEVIDEAQNIKNHGTQTARTVKRIQAEARFALSGTPIENRLSELWSIFDYLMPGILGSHDRFRKQYELPITVHQEAAVSERLRKIVSPFILRRIKKDVLKELPDKIEKDIFIQMEDEQRKIYMAHAKRLKDSLEKQSKEEIQKGKLQILAELTRLRQVCCSPSLIYDNYGQNPCKMEVFLNLIKEAWAGNHKVLVFSQFTSLFPALEEILKKNGLKYYVLTGETSKEKRGEMADSFNTDDVPVFLISLKAGGTGLNLTGASIVVHFDPWWNVAAQNQATDRAHRIGQDKKVTVYRLIAKDSIEEKILELQEKKKELAGQILSGEGISAASLTKEDLMEIVSEGV